MPQNSGRGLTGPDRAISFAYASIAPRPHSSSSAASAILSAAGSASVVISAITAPTATPTTIRITMAAIMVMAILLIIVALEGLPVLSIGIAAGAVIADSAVKLTRREEEVFGGIM
jgi:hypothetical protein